MEDLLESKQNSFSTPRFLTLKEINDVLKNLPKVKSATIESSDMATNQIKAKLKLQLRELKVCPEKIPELEGLIINAFYRSRISPGEPVGITAAEGIGGPATQMTLSGFHQAGSSKNVGSGVDIIRELLNMSQKRRVETTTLHFRDKNLTFEDVIKYRRQIVGVTIQDLLKTTPRIHNSQPGNYNQRGWWYDAYMKINGIKSIESTKYARLIINRSRMYSFNLTPESIIETLNSEENKTFICIPSPSINSECYIDVYVDISEIGGADTDLMVLKLSLIPELSKFLIRGIKGIMQIFPKTVRTISLIRSCEKIMRPIDIEEEIRRLKFEGYDPKKIQMQKNDLENTWRIWINTIEYKVSGIPLSKLEKLIRLCGFKFIINLI